MQLFHVASPLHVKAGDVLTTSIPTNVDSVQRHVLEMLFPPDGAVSSWGESMLADKSLRLTACSLIDDGLASVPGAVGASPGSTHDRTLHVTEKGRTAMNDTCNRVIEVALEIARRTDPTFLALPRRLTCVFAYDNQAAAEDYRQDRRPNSGCRIWAIEVDRQAVCHHADGGWLGVPRDALSWTLGLINYWRGTPRPDRPSSPIEFEVLVPSGAATVVGEVA